MCARSGRDGGSPVAWEPMSRATLPQQRTRGRQQVAVHAGRGDCHASAGAREHERHPVVQRGAQPHHVLTRARQRQCIVFSHRDQSGARLDPHDEAFARRAAQAQAQGQRLVYAASYDGHVARAGLVAMAERDALALARPGENVVRLRTALHDRVPLVLAGPGAGVAITAAGVHGDLLSAARALLRQRGAEHGLARDRRTTVATGARAHPAWA